MARAGSGGSSYKALKAKHKRDKEKLILKVLMVVM